LHNRESDERKGALLSPSLFPDYLNSIMLFDTHGRMISKPKTRRITANLPTELLEEACQISGAGVTETITRGLYLIKHGATLAKASRLRGRLKLDLDLQHSRQRPGR
jgi:hypothetical protein